MEEKKQIRWWVEKVVLFIERVRNNWHFGKRGKWIWWTGDMTGAAVLDPGNPQLRTLNLHSKDFLMVFFKNESKGTLDFGKNPPFWSFLIIIEAEIAARIKEDERLWAEKQANFLRYIRTKNDKKI